MIDEGAPVNNEEDSYTCLNWAIENFSINVSEKLISKGADVNAGEEPPLEALMRYISPSADAVDNAKESQVIKLVQMGAAVSNTKAVKFIYEGSGSKPMQVKAVINKGVLGDMDKLLREYTYDGFNRVSEIMDYYDVSDLISSKYTLKTYDIDDYGRVISLFCADKSDKDNLVEIYEFFYDKKGQITSEKVRNNYSDNTSEQINKEKSYEYDDIDRLVSYIVEDKKEITDDEKSSSVSVSYTYDKIGNRLSVDDGTMTNYQYNELNELVKTADEEGGTLTAYTYDLSSSYWTKMSYSLYNKNKLVHNRSTYKPHWWTTAFQFGKIASIYDLRMRNITIDLKTSKNVKSFRSYNKPGGWYFSGKKLKYTWVSDKSQY